MSDIEDRAATWTQPISDDQPAGEDSRYEPQFEEVVNEVNKLKNLDIKSREDLTDWRKVLKLSTELLQKQTKDTTILGHLCVALLHVERYSGLAAGLLAYKEVVAQHWEQMYPALRRIRGRAGDYKWMMDQLSKAVDPQFEMPDLSYIENAEERAAKQSLFEEVQRETEKLRPTPADLDGIKASLEHFAALSELLNEKFAKVPGDLLPAVGGFRRTLRRYDEELSALLPKEAPPAEEGAGDEAAGAMAEAGGEGVAAWADDKTPVDTTPPVVVSGGADAGGMIPSTIASEQQAQQVVDQATKALKLAAEYYTKKREQLEEEKRQLEDRIRQARKVIKMEKNVVEMLTAEGDDDEEEESND